MSEHTVPAGKLIVIEGTDGSGKGTQVGLLAERWAEAGKKFEIADFPRYKTPNAYFVEKYLRGEYGGVDEVGPRTASYFYALDRFDAAFGMRKCLAEGRHIISNRYVTSSMAHQAAKIDSVEEQDAFLDWLDTMEHVDLNIPRPDFVVFLYVPPEIGQELVAQKAKREYTQGQSHDIHENSLDHLQKASRAYLRIAEKYGWLRINCVCDGMLMPREEIHELVYKAVEEFLD